MTKKVYLEVVELGHAAKFIYTKEEEKLLKVVEGCFKILKVKKY